MRYLISTQGIALNNQPGGGAMADEVEGATSADAEVVHDREGFRLLMQAAQRLHHVRDGNVLHQHTTYLAGHPFNLPVLNHPAVPPYKPFIGYVGHPDHPQESVESLLLAVAHTMSNGPVLYTRWITATRRESHPMWRCWYEVGAPDVVLICGGFADGYGVDNAAAERVNAVLAFLHNLFAAPHDNVELSNWDDLYALRRNVERAKPGKFTRQH